MEAGAARHHDEHQLSSIMIRIHVVDLCNESSLHSQSFATKERGESTWQASAHSRETPFAFPFLDVFSGPRLHLASRCPDLLLPLSPLTSKHTRPKKNSCPTRNLARTPSNPRAIALRQRPIKTNVSAFSDGPNTGEGERVRSDAVSHPERTVHTPDPASRSCWYTARYALLFVSPIGSLGLFVPFALLPQPPQAGLGMPQPTP